jgi:hypothetical protein
LCDRRRRLGYTADTAEHAAKIIELEERSLQRRQEIRGKGQVSFTQEKPVTMIERRRSASAGGDPVVKFGAICMIAALTSIAAPTVIAAQSLAKSAQVTQIIREVNLLPSKAEARRATVNDRVTEGEAVRTGDNSRSELTFADLTISRLGANTIFSFNKAGRDAQLNSGSVLLRVPKDSGGAGIHTSAVSVAVTGTTLILDGARSGRSKLMVLEGGARLSLVKYPRQSQFAHAGQMIDVPPGATTVPPPVDVDLNQVMKTHPLITEFRPLPSYPLIVAAAQQQRPAEPVYTGRPVSGQPIISRPGGGRGIGLPPFGRTDPRDHRRPPPPRKKRRPGDDYTG